MILLFYSWLCYVSSKLATNIFGCKFSCAEVVRKLCEKLFCITKIFITSGLGSQQVLHSYPCLSILTPILFDDMIGFPSLCIIEITVLNPPQADNYY